MAATKKAATKKAAKTARKMVSANDPFYAVIERGIASGKIIGLYTTREDASNHATALENTSMLPFNRYVVQRADLIA